MGMPNYDAVNVGENSTPMSRDVYNDAHNSSSDKLYSSAMSGTDAAQGLLGADSGFEGGLGRPDAMSAAIQAKQGREAGIDSAQLKFDVKMKSKDAYYDKLLAAQDAVGREQALNYQKAVAKYKQQQNAKKARAALVGQVLGLAGAVGGAYVGGTGGAMAGNAAGNMAGQALAGG